MEKVSLHNFHVPLPKEIFNELREEASRSAQPATALARQAIEEWLRQRRKAARHRTIAAYAAEHAGSRNDLDPELEAAAVEHLQSETKTAKGKSKIRKGGRR
jgi:hypothetical protein